jgi:hypothetical protein
MLKSEQATSAILKRALASMSRGVDLRGVFAKSAALAAAIAVFNLPYFHYLIFAVPNRTSLAVILKPWGFLWAEIFLLFMLGLLASMVGFSFVDRYKLPGLGDPKGLIGSLPGLLAVGAAMITLSYFLFDRYFFVISPHSYPQDFLYLLSLPFQGAFTDEIILRFCLVTLCMGIFKRKSLAVIFVSALASLFSVKYFYFFGIMFDLNVLSLTHLLLSLSSNLILGYVFVSRGLIYSITLKFIFSLKYFIVYWAMGS